MIFFNLAVALLVQVPAPPPVAPDTIPTALDTLPVAGRIYDSPATAELVRRSIEMSASVPAELLDYRATVRSSLFLTLAPDTAAGGDLPATVDELVSDVRWNRQGSLHQTVRGHRTRVLIPVPYTLATIFQQPWVIPHLYGNAIFSPFAGPRAINPFGSRGPEFYDYQADDPIRLRVQGQLVTLVPISVRPRIIPEDDQTVVVLGTFYIDQDRAAVAQARYGFAGGRGDLPRALGRLETFLELENGLWEGRFWLPFRQRREIFFNSPLLGGGASARVVNQFTDFDLNTGWFAEGPRVQLVWEQGSPREVFAGWEQAVGEDAGRYATQDFADLRLAIATDAGGPQRTRARLHYARGNHLFRYNRVEGAYLGLGGQVVPPDPLRNRWELYGTAGWAIAEGTPRGELSARFGSVAAPSPRRLTDFGGEVAVYRRLVDIRPFRPTYDWDLIYTIPAILWGSDVRDYYDVTGAEAFASGRHGRWTGRLGGRLESQDSVQINTTRFLFGTAGDFGPLASIDPGTHAALEAGAGYSFGPGAFGMGNSVILRGDVEQGVADFQFTRLAGLISARFNLGPVTLANRTDAGHVMGGVPPQKLFRFGGLEGLRGYESNEFGGSTAVLTRGRFLVGIPPRSTQPLARAGLFLVPPLRPSLVFLAESGWTWIDDDLQEELLRLRARPTEGARSSIGFGISFLDDAITIERLQPIGADQAERRPRWYAGLTYWY
ncbi:hypothetical protein BH23GEM6_BH23GEM6_00670 [soil metagenome]